MIVEGIATTVFGEAARQNFADEYAIKYDWNLSLDTVAAIHVVRPSVVFGWIAVDLAQESTLFQATATRSALPRLKPVSANTSGPTGDSP